MAVSNYVAILRIAYTNLFNGIIIIPTILALTLVMEVDASEDYSPIVPTTYDASVLDTEGQTIFTNNSCLLYTSPSPRDKRQSRMPSSA